MAELANRAPARPGVLPARWGAVLDLGWIVTVAGPVWSGVVRPLSQDESASVLPAVCVKVDDMDARVSRCFGRDPEGNVVNVLSQR